MRKKFSIDELKPVLKEIVRELISELRKSAQSQEGLATINEAAEFLSVSRSTIYSLIYDDKLETMHLGRAVRIRWDSLKSFVKQKPREAKRRPANS